MTVYNVGDIYLEDLNGGTSDQLHIMAQTANIADGAVTAAKLAGDLAASIVIKDGYRQVNELNTTFFTIGENRYDASSATDGVMLDQVTEGTHEDASFTTSGFIYVGDLSSTLKFMRLSANGTSYINDSAYYVLYDSDRNRLGSRQVATSVDVTGAVWLRVSNNIQYKSTFMIVDNDLTVSEYIPYAFTFNYLTDIVNMISGKVDKDGTGQVTEQNTTFFTAGDNKFNPSDTVDGVQLNQSTDGTHEQSGFSTSGYIDVSDLDSVAFYRQNSAGTAYVADSCYYTMYNENKVMTAARALASTADVSGASYIRVSFSTDNKPTLMVCDSALTVTEYIPFGYFFDYADDREEVTVYPTDHVLAKLVANRGKDIYFAAGNYDVIAIYEDYFGSDFFTNYTTYSSDMLLRGIPVYQGTKMTFSPNARFTANYNGSNTYVRQNFSAFAFEGGVTFDGLNITASGIRNVIHDDFDNAYVGRTVIKNCHIVHDYIILAGGLALHEIVEIYNNYFERTDTTAHVFDISYHQNGVSGAQGELIIKDNWCSKGVSIRYYGPSTLISDCMISNNSMANDVEYRAENETATVENMRVLKWNNEIRSA